MLWRQESGKEWLFRTEKGAPCSADFIDLGLCVCSRLGRMRGSVKIRVTEPEREGRYSSIL